MVVIEQKVAPGELWDEELVLPFELRQKSRFQTKLASGEEARLVLPRGTVLRGGDCLRANDGRIVKVIAAPERVLTVRLRDARRLARCAYHLGNRHVAVELGDGWLRVAFDHVIRDLLLGLGVQVVEEEAPFEPEAGAYGHHLHEGPGIIHEFRKR